METKKYKANLELKAEGEPGDFVAEFATLNVKDLHNDVTVPGAFSEQTVFIEGWNHDYSLPVGEGTIFEEGDKAKIKGKFFLTTTPGRDHYETVKSATGVQWSYTFRVIESEKGVFEGEDVQFLRKMDVVGVAPVTRGAGIGTRTLSIKSKTDEPEKPEGEVVTDKPSGVSPAVKLIQIEILELED